MSLWKSIIDRFAGSRRDPSNNQAMGGQASSIDAMHPNTLTVAQVVLGAYLARIDGTISRSEVESFKRVFGFAPADAGPIALLFDQARQDTVDIGSYTRQATRQYRDRPEVLEQLLDGLFAMACADRHLDERELTALRKIAGLLEIDDAVFARTQARHSPSRDPYAVLGIPRNADEMAVRMTHRRLAQTFNPDQLVSQGLPRELLRPAHAKAAAIDEAFERICRDRKFTRAST